MIVSLARPKGVNKKIKTASLVPIPMIDIGKRLINITKVDENDK